MAFAKRVLVLANQTADTDGLVHALLSRAHEGGASFLLLVPAGRGSKERAEERLVAALERMRAAGLDVDGQVCDADPLFAVNEVWSPAEFDEAIVSTLERGISSWLDADLPHRIARIIDAPVSHVVPSEIERSLARQRVARPAHHPPQRSLGPFAGPAAG